ncbi:ABC transporter ATP-binding protein [Phytohabitans aurantiacus]|uniref:Oligopeptide ABC transporter ATP-binding protein OppD n=1 Tax=Phytohabitans aurantiacus TaxID=3016789 RepID=A0ABQ5QYA0_9ACTN|nr:ABC transporter ATP-binding protein [Phytohabitans aurantiacus]GLH99022.1 oligopeptide ABC transporter ATP-binding protein OppD [Phytohabitans aurantiacus]
MTALLEVRDLAVEYDSGERRVRALDGADLTVAAGETIGIVGESGSGKSTLGSAVGRLLPSTANRVTGDVWLAGERVFDLPPAGIRRLRRERLGFVFQDPIASLDPTMRVGKQLKLVLGSKGDPLSHLDRVRLANPGRVARMYPHQLSGGMAQRVALAIAMACQPRLLIADEPTAALDAQVREEVLEVVFSVAAEAGTSIVWLSHDLTAVARRCSRVAVMYGGRVVEDGPAADVLGQPAHPYTAALARSAPAMASLGDRLSPVPGRPPVLAEASHGCAFEPRCPYAEERCAKERPELHVVRTQEALCHRATELVTAS